MTRRPPLLEGERPQVALVARAAMDLVRPLTEEEWWRRLSWMAQSRRHALRELWALGHGQEARALAANAERYGAAGVAWWVTMGIGASLSMAGAAGLLPPKASSSSTLSDQLVTAPPVLAAGAVLLLGLALLPVPKVVRESQYARATAIMVGILVALAVAFNLFRAGALAELAESGRVGLWWAAAAVAVVCCIALGVRSGELRSRTRFHWRAESREAGRHARWLLRHSPAADHRLSATWTNGLRQQGIDPDTPLGSQAVELGPWVCLVAAYYDGGRGLPVIQLARDAGPP